MALEIHGLVLPYFPHRSCTPSSNLSKGTDKEMSVKNYCSVPLECPECCCNFPHQCEKHVHDQSILCPVAGKFKLDLPSPFHHSYPFLLLFASYGGCSKPHPHLHDWLLSVLVGVFGSCTAPKNQETVRKASICVFQSVRRGAN